jgi:hypothetical protein
MDESPNESSEDLTVMQDRGEREIEREREDERCLTGGRGLVSGEHINPLT